jgi:hypothetical protein
METYPEFILDIIDSINELAINRYDDYDLSDETFDRKHHFSQFVSYFTHYYHEPIIEQSHGDYFIMRLKDNYLGIYLVEYEDSNVILYMLLQDDLNSLRNKFVYRHFENDEGNYCKFYKY